MLVCIGIGSKVKVSEFWHYEKFKCVLNTDLNSIPYFLIIPLHVGTV